MYMMHYDERAGRAILRNFQGRVFEYLDPGRDPTSVALNSGMLELPTSLSKVDPIVNTKKR
jgi:hypothetical protein